MLELVQVAAAGVIERQIMEIVEIAGLGKAIEAGAAAEVAGGPEGG